MIANQALELSKSASIFVARDACQTFGKLLITYQQFVTTNTVSMHACFDELHCFVRAIRSVVFLVRLASLN